MNGFSLHIEPPSYVVSLDKTVMKPHLQNLSSEESLDPDQAWILIVLILL